MIERLAIVKQRFDEVSDLIIQPEVIADQKRYIALNREYKDLSALMEKRKQYLKPSQRLKEAEEIISDGSDPEMSDMAKEELEEVKSKLPALEETIRFMLIPKDPEDAKNVVMELRAGTGGDEASIFAGDLYRMYTKNTARGGGGKSVLLILVKVQQVDSKKSSSKCQEQMSMEP